jgi:hypothetical protein
MGVKTVPVFDKFIVPEKDWVGEAVIDEDGRFNEMTGEWIEGPITEYNCRLQPVDAGEYVKNLAEKYYDGPDPIGKTHIREGVVVRIINRPKFCAYKHKNFEFKVLEGIIKDMANHPDIEEAQEIDNA